MYTREDEEMRSRGRPQFSSFGCRLGAITNHNGGIDIVTAAPEITAKELDRHVYHPLM